MAIEHADFEGVERLALVTGTVPTVAFAWKGGEVVVILPHQCILIYQKYSTPVDSVELLAEGNNGQFNLLNYVLVRRASWI